MSPSALYGLEEMPFDSSDGIEAISGSKDHNHYYSFLQT